MDQPVSRHTSERGTATRAEVLAYYERNWQDIVSCYDIGEDGLPKDPAYYRRRIYLHILRETGADHILDVGCGGGRTVLDALQMGRVVMGIEPVEPLVRAARDLIAANGYDPAVIAHSDMADVQGWTDRIFGTVAVLSVLPHVSPDRWDVTHMCLADRLQPDGYFISSYRNDLFDLYTFNSFTIDFIVKSLWDCPPCRPLQVEAVDGLRGLVQNPDVPGRQFTTARDKSFGRLMRVRSNPLQMPAYLATFGLRVVRTFFYNYHCTPPLLRDATAEFRLRSHQMDMEMSEDWRGHFMASTFVVLAQKAGPGAR